MRVLIEHRMAGRFDPALGRLVVALRVTPDNTHDQTVARWAVEPGRDARVRERRDGFGNRVTTLYVDGPVDALKVAVRGEVLTSHSDGVVHGSLEPLPPALFLRGEAKPEVAKWARGIGGRDRLDALHRIADALHEDGGEVDRFVAAARSIGAPARFVSGWCVDRPDADGGPGRHCWAEAHVDGIGWIAFDPALGECPTERHARGAVALTRAGAAPSTPALTA